MASSVGVVRALSVGERGGSAVRALRVSAGFDPRHGGPAQSTLLSTLATHSAGVDVEVATINEGKASAAAIDRLRAAGIPVHAFPLSSVPAADRLTISRPLAVWVWSNAGRFDVIHVHGAWTASTLAGVAAARAHRIPVVLTPHESLTAHDVGTSGHLGRIFKRRIRSLYLRSTAKIVYASQIEQQDSEGRRGGPHAIVAHPVEPVGARRLKRDVNGVVQIGFLGRFDPKKNLDVLMRALPSDAALVIAGDGPEEERRKLRAVAQEAGISERVLWLGFVDGEEKARFFERIDLLVMPSRYECFGMVAAEALAASVPVVVSPTTGIASLVRAHDCGYVVEPDATSLGAVLTSRDGLAEKARRADRVVEEELSLERHGAALAQIYRSVLSERL